MKKYLITIAAAALAFASCDILDKAPQAEMSPESYFKTEQDLQLFSNTFYNNLLPKSPFSNQSDCYVKQSLSDELHGGTYRIVPSSGSGWSWGDLRKMNTLLGYINNCEDEDAVREYTALTKFFRAYFYFEKVKRFGDVPWIDAELGSESAQLYAPRDSRELVMQKMIDDIDYAIANLPDKVSTFRVNKWAALALKAEFCLYEGTFRMYHAGHITLETLPEDATPYTTYLDLAAAAAKQVMDSGLYSLAPDYQLLFAADDADAKEYILAIKNDQSLNVRNNTTAYGTMPTQGCPGLTKKFVDSYLMKDGSRFTDKEGWATMQYKEQMADRDPRLAASTVTPGYVRLGATDISATDLSCSSTGYQLVKWVMDINLPEVGRVDMSYNDIPVFRIAEMYLIYAEALAENETKTITQNDLDISVNLLRDRVGMPHMNLTEANANPDWYLCSEEYGYRNVSGSNKGIILEIRRERAIELFKEGFRWDDLMRWKEGLCINQVMYGHYFPGLGEYDLTGDNKADIVLYEGKKPAEKAGVAAFEVGTLTGVVLSEGTKGYINPQPQENPQNAHVFDESRDYYYPIPSTERSLNPNLTQNPNWKDGLGE